MLRQAKPPARATFFRRERNWSISSLLCKLHLLESCCRCVSEYGEVLVDGHHPVSVQFLGRERLDQRRPRREFERYRHVREAAFCVEQLLRHADGRHRRRDTARVQETLSASLQDGYLKLAIQHRATQKEQGLHRHSFLAWCPGQIGNGCGTDIQQSCKPMSQNEDLQACGVTTVRTESVHGGIVSEL